MSINLEEHKVFIEEKGIDMVPFEIAIKAQTESLNKEQFDSSLDELNDALKELKSSIGDINL